MPTLSDIKEIYLLRNKIFTIRFFPLALVIIILLPYIINTYGILNQMFIYTICLVIVTFLFSVYWIRFDQKNKYISDLFSKGKFLIAYQEINNLQNEPLWESELIELKLHRAMLFYYVGNIKRFLSLMDDLSEEILKYPNKVYFYRLLNAFKYEINNDFTSAITELEKIIENTLDNYLKSQANNNIGRLEKTRGNYISAQTFYFNAFESAKLTPNKSFLSVYSHNLLMIYATNNQPLKAKELLKETLTIIDKNKPQEMVEYANNITHYARAINDNELLKQSYEIIKENFTMLKSDEQFAINISELRMRYNDNNDFENHYRKTFSELKNNHNLLSLDEKLMAIGEFRHVLSQYIQTKKNFKEKENDFKWIAKWHLSLENDILEKLKDIESSLSNIRVYWLNQLVLLKKSDFAFDLVGYLPKVQAMIKYIDEIINIWKDANNPIMQIESLLHVMDEIIALMIDTRDLKLEELYDHKIKEVFYKTNQLLEENWQQPGNEHFMIGIAWFSYQIIEDKDISKRWLNRFDNPNHSIKHYAQFIQNEYINTKYWLDE
ncbi:MAG: hypothetical protein DRG78_16975 [Epsilonproteobacteria bacterium]|nr:MAG: hypothetical protein DRG78_16975 [Campylobacterota bacterium]